MNLSERVHRAISEVKIIDFHTHLYQPSFGMTLWGIDELLTYHYLVAEVMRFAPTTPTAFLAMSKQQQADMIWEYIFGRNTPVSESAVGVLNVLNAFGLNGRARDLSDARKFFASQSAASHFHRVMDMAGVEALVMTNDPLDPIEALNWERKADLDPRFHAALRIDPILNNWPDATKRLKAKGYSTYASIDETSLAEIRRFLTDWIKIMRPKYMAVSLPPSFAYPEESYRATVLAKAVLPICEEHNLPFAMMIGVNKRVHPELVEAGDSVGVSDMTVIERLCHAFPVIGSWLQFWLARTNTDSA
jgi:predicted TIM-barrel fold metal-dependent hydrolase